LSLGVDGIHMHAEPVLIMVPGVRVSLVPEVKVAESIAEQVSLVPTTKISETISESVTVTVGP